MAEKKQARLFFLQRRSVRWGAGLLITLVVVLGLLPVVAKQLLISNLEKLGASQVSLQQLDLNLFKGRVALYGLQLEGEDATELQLKYLEIRLSPFEAIFKRHIEIESIILSDVELDVAQQDNGQWLIAGLSLPAAAQEEPEQSPDQLSEPWEFTLKQVAFDSVHTQLSLPDFKQHISLQSLMVGMISSQHIEHNTPYQLQLVIDKTQLTIEGEAKPLRDTPQLSATLDLQRLPLHWLQPYVTPHGVEQISGQFNLTLQLAAELAEKIKLNGQVEARVEQLSLGYQHYQLAMQTLEWVGDYRYLSPEDSASLGLQLDGQLQMNQLGLRDQQQVVLAEFDQLTLSQVALQADQQLTFEQLLIEQLRLLQQPSPLVSLESLSLQQFSYDGAKAVTLDGIVLDGLLVDVTLSAEGEVVQLAELLHDAVEESKGDESPAAVGPKPAESWHYRLGQLVINENSRILFHDQSVSPAFKGELKPLSLSLQGLDSRTPKRASQLALSTQLNKHQAIELVGELTPLNETLDIKIHGTTQALDLPPLSPYVEKHLGYYLRRGLLDSEFDISVQQQQLDAQIHLNLKKFQLEEGDPATVKSMTDELAMPLDSALDLLRDGDDNIKLELAITGDINAPEFDASQVINKALGKATRVAAVSYVKHLLQPWGALWSVAEMVGDAMVTRFDPVEFVAGESELGENYELYLEKMSTLLLERPKLQLNLCGLTSEQDRAALLAALPPVNVEQENTEVAAVPEISNQQLMQLAELRAEVVKGYMVEAGVEPGRLYTCRPEIKGAEKQAPIVDLYL